MLSFFSEPSINYYSGISETNNKSNIIDDPDIIKIDSTDISQAYKQLLLEELNRVKDKQFEDNKEYYLNLMKEYYNTICIEIFNKYRIIYNGLYLSNINDTYEKKYKELLDKNVSDKINQISYDILNNQSRGKYINIYNRLSGLINTVTEYNNLITTTNNINFKLDIGEKDYYLKLAINYYLNSLNYHNNSTSNIDIVDTYVKLIKEYDDSKNILENINLLIDNKLLKYTNNIILNLLMISTEKFIHQTIYVKNNNYYVPFIVFNITNKKFIFKYNNKSEYVEVLYDNINKYKTYNKILIGEIDNIKDRIIEDIINTKLTKYNIEPISLHQYMIAYTFNPKLKINTKKLKQIKKLIDKLKTYKQSKPDGEITENIKQIVNKLETIPQVNNFNNLTHQEISELLQIYTTYINSDKFSEISDTEIVSNYKKIIGIIIKNNIRISKNINYNSENIKKILNSAKINKLIYLSKLPKSTPQKEKYLDNNKKYLILIEKYKMKSISGFYKPLEQIIEEIGDNQVLKSQAIVQFTSYATQMMYNIYLHNKHTNTKQIVLKKKCFKISVLWK